MHMWKKAVIFTAIRWTEEAAVSQTDKGEGHTNRPATTSAVLWGLSLFFPSGSVQQHGLCSSQEPWTRKAEEEDTDDVMFHTLSDSSLLLLLPLLLIPAGRGDTELKAQSLLAHKVYKSAPRVKSSLIHPKLFDSVASENVSTAWAPLFMNGKCVYEYVMCFKKMYISYKQQNISLCSASLCYISLVKHYQWLRTMLRCISPDTGYCQLNLLTQRIT